MANKSYHNHAKNERDLARTVAQETLIDLYGGEIRTYNVTGLIVAVTTLLTLTAGVITVLYLIFGGG